MNQSLRGQKISAICTTTYGIGARALIGCRHVTKPGPDAPQGAAPARRLTSPACDAFKAHATGDQAGWSVSNIGAVKGCTIEFVPLAETPARLAWRRVETEGHEIILANGAASETFVDAVTRSHFDNYGEYLALYGAERIIPEMPAPRIASQRLLPQAIRARLRLGAARHVA